MRNTAHITEAPNSTPWGFTIRMPYVTPLKEPYDSVMSAPETKPTQK